MKKLYEKVFASRYHHYLGNNPETKSGPTFKGSKRKTIAGIRVTPDLDPDSVFSFGVSETAADALISSVLGEARGRPAVDDDSLGRDYNFSRRSTNFATGLAGSARIKKYFDKTTRVTGISPETNIKHIFGEGFKDTKTHFRNVHLIPALINQSMLAHDAFVSGKPVHPGINLIPKNRLDTIRKDAGREAARHIYDITKEIDRHCENRLNKLSHGPIIKNPMDYVQQDDFLLTHDALDHGMSGALPSKFGEIVASHMAELRNIHHLSRQPGNELNPKTNMLAKLRFEKSRQSLQGSTMNELVKLYGKIGLQLGAHDLSNHDQLMKISNDRKSWGEHMEFLQRGKHPLGSTLPLRGANPDQKAGEPEHYLLGGRY